MSGSYGMALAPFMEGYQKGSDWQDRKRRNDKREDRQDKFEPIALEAAMLRLKEARRSGELAEFTQQYKKNAAVRIDAAGGRKEKRDKSALPGDLASDYYDRERNADEFQIHQESMPGRIKKVGYEDSANANANELGQMSHAGNKKRVGYGDTAASNANELQVQQHPFNVAAGKFAGEVQTDQIGDYGEDREQFALQENINNALADTALTGDPQPLMDAYAMIDDGIEAVIKRIPTGKNTAGGDRYVVSVNNGQADVTFESKEALLKATEEVFRTQMQAQQPVRGYGIDPNAMGGEGPADVQTAEWLIEAMQGMEKYAHLSPDELRDAAFERVTKKASASPQDRLNEFFMTTFTAQMKPNSYGQKPDPKEAFAIAEEMTRKLAQRMSGSPAPKAGDESEDPEQDVNDFVHSMIGRKRPE